VWSLLIGAVFAADFVVLPEPEVLRPGLPAVVWVAVLDESHRGPPVVDIEGGAFRFGSEGSRDGVWPLVVTPHGGVETLELAIRAGTQSTRVALEVGWPNPGQLDVPARVEAVVQDPEPIRIRVTGPNIPPPELLQVVVGEGTVQGVEVVEGGLELAILPGDSPFPRRIPFGIRDSRGDSRPSWGTIRLRARPRIPLQAEPGATLQLEVGGRQYGPFESDSNGKIIARVDQYPGETVANAVLIDDLGNRTASAIPLASQDKAMLVAISGDRARAQGAPRLVYLRAVDGDGRAWRGAAPSCRSAAVGSLAVIPITQGLYAVPIQGRFSQQLVDVRLECRLGAEAGASIRVGPRPGVASRLLLQVWPTELSTDLPLAEVRVAVEDARGQRLDSADVEIYADHGVVDVREPGQAEYRGDRAVEVGRDEIHARYSPPASTGPVHRLEVGWDRTAAGLTAYARAVDAVGAPVRDAQVGFSFAPPGQGTGEPSVVTATSESGWAESAAQFVEPGPILLRATSGAVVARALVLPGTRGSVAPGDALLESTQQITLSPGRVAGISVNVDPPILRTGRASVAWVSVQLEDLAGNPVADESVHLEVSEGTVGPLITRPDGSWVAEYVPTDSDRPREVTITAKTDALRSTARLTLEPQLGRISVGPQVGWISNFGTVSSPVVGLDVDLRTRLLAESVLVRASVQGYGLASTTPTGLGEDARIIGGVYPVTLAAMLRQDRGGVSFYGGAGGTIALHTVTTRFGNRVVSRGNRAVTGGVALGGVGYRLGLGDLVAEARWTWLPGPGGEVGFTGNIGGLAAGLSFRVVY